MIKWLRSVFFLLLCHTGFCQHYRFEFLGKEYDSYLNTLFQLRPNHFSLDHMFFDSLHHHKRNIGAPVSFALSDMRYRTSADSLAQRVFRVVHIVAKGEQSMLMSVMESYPVMVLQDVETKDTIYYRYDPYSSYRFPFLVKGLEVEEDRYCGAIKQKELSYGEGLYFHTSQRGDPVQCPVSAHKTVQKGGGKTYSLLLRCFGMRPHSRVKGVIVFLTDGSRIIRNDASITVNATTRGYEYRASIKLSTDELGRLQEIGIAKHRLYIYDQEVLSAFSHQFKMQIRCLTRLGE